MTSSGRMSLAACGCCCPPDAGTCSARTQKFSGTARDDGHGERHWVRLLLHGPVASVVLASAVSLWSTLYTETMAASGRLGRCLVMRQSTVAFEIIPSPLCSRSSHLESGALFPLSLYLAVIVPRVWVLLRST